MKKLFVGWMLLFTGVVFVAHAHAPVVSIDAVPDMVYETFPQAYGVTGIIVHNPVSSVKNLTLRVNGAVESVIADPFVLAVGTSSVFSLPWTITAPGTYTLSVTARHGVTGQTGTSTDEVTEVVLEEVVVACAAAPAIAGDYMRNVLGVKPAATTFKAILQAVAHETGEGGVLWAKHACDAGYGELVKMFVDESMSE